MKITLIPLDSRPCNTTWIEDYAKRTNILLKMYPKELCGNLFVGADSDLIFEWLDKEIIGTDYLIIAADGICSGGLVQARLGLVDIDKIIKKLNILEKYKQENKHLKIYIFDTIMRTSITTYDKESEFYWGKMNEYSKLLGRCYFFKNQEDFEQLSAIQSGIPANIINRYHQARYVKNQLNKHFIELVSKNIIDYLLLLQEDSMPYGIQKVEQIGLIELINQLYVQNRVAFYNGTDEGAAVLFAKIIIEKFKLHPKIYIHKPLEYSLDKIMLFEDQILIDNLHHMFETIGFEDVLNRNDADFILSIYTEDKDQNLDLNSTNNILPNKNNNYYQYIKELNEFIDANKKVAFVDLLFPNGGSDSVLKDIHYQNLSVYSAWNTASNSLGSCLGEIACILVNPNHPVKNHVLERIIDDCIYQYIVRRIINEKWIKMKVNIHNLEENYQMILDEINQEMKNHTNFLGDLKYSIDLPWRRTFEIEIKIED